MSKQDLLSIIPFLGKYLIEKEAFNKKTTSNDDFKYNTVESYLPFSYISNNIIKICDGKYRGIAKTNAISLDDMSKEDQNNILRIFADFNNGLINPYQIFIPTFSEDLRNIIEKLEERYEEESNDAIRAWIKDEIEFQKKLVEENDIMDTQFYIIFTSEFVASNNEDRDLVKAKKELSRLIKFASDELEGIGLKLLQLNDQEIVKLYYYFYNPFSAGLQEPEFNNTVVKSEKIDLTIEPTKLLNNDTTQFDLQSSETKILNDGDITLKQKISPYSINYLESPLYIRCGDTYMTVYEIYDFPRILPRLWAQKLYRFRKNIDISIHIKPIMTSLIVKELDKASIRYQSSLIDEKTGNKKKAITMIEKRMESSSDDIQMIMEELDSGEEGFFHYSMYIRIKAKNLDDLNNTVSEMENVLGSMRVLFRRCSDNLKNALTSVFPISLDTLGTTRNMLTSGISNAFPFTNFSFTHKNKDKSFLLGTHKYNMSLIHFNPYELENANGVVLGTSGSGKSVTVKKITKGFISNMDIAIRMIDPEGECKLKIFDTSKNIESSFAKSIDAEVIDYYVGSSHKINILEIEPDDEVPSLIKPQINFVKIFLSYILKDIQRSDMSKLDYCLINLYNSFGFTDDKSSYFDESKNNLGIFYMGKPVRRPPTLYDLYLLLNSNKLIDAIGDCKHIASQLAEWTRIGSIDLFDGDTNVNFKNKRLIFNLKNLDSYTKEPAIFVLFQKIWDISRRNPLDQKALITDESHILFRNDQMGEYAYDINKRFRKYGGSAIWVSQNPTDFMKTKWGPEIIKNCSFSILMRQQKADVDILKDMYQMTESESLKMTKFNTKKGEAYLIADDYRIPINIRVSDNELRTFTTRLQDLQMMSKNLNNLNNLNEG